MLKYFVPSMLAQDTPSVICNTSSYAGLLTTGAQGFAGGVSYVASKHALTTLTESLCHEMRVMEPPSKISVHGLFPALVDTNFSERRLARTGLSQFLFVPSRLNPRIFWQWRTPSMRRRRRCRRSWLPTASSATRSGWGCRRGS